MTKRLTETEIDRRMAELDGISGSTGHRVTDPYVRFLLRKNIAGEITSAKYQKLVLKHVLKGRRPRKWKNI